jgi:hypothetical protein
MITRRSIFGLLLGAWSIRPAAGANVLPVAMWLSEKKFAGYQWGLDRSKKQIDCCSFLIDVVQQCVRRPLTSEEKRAIAMNYKFTNLNKAIDANDPRTRGVQYALVDLMRIGRPVKPKEATQGDFVQYWIKGSNGYYTGHSAIISHVWKDSSGKPRAEIYGSNKSTKGIAFTRFKSNSGLLLEGPGRRVHIARLLG